MKKISSFFPKPEPEFKLQLVQAHVEQNLLHDVMKQREKDGISWRVLLESMFKAYLAQAKENEENGKKKSLEKVG